MKQINIFLSYCKQDSNVADNIYNYFKNKKNIELHRDIINNKPWNSIKKYMESLNNMDYTILLISNEYLKSANCMYEILDIMRDRNYRNRIFPTVINLGIYNPIVRKRYVQYWEKQFKELNIESKDINVHNLDYDLKRYEYISSNIAQILDLLSDMNNPNTRDVLVRIEQKLNMKGFIENNQVKSDSDLFDIVGKEKLNDILGKNKPNKSVIENNQKYLSGEIWEKYKANNSVVENNQKYLSGEIWEKYKANNSVVENNQKYLLGEIWEKNKANKNLVENNQKYLSGEIWKKYKANNSVVENNQKYLSGEIWEKYKANNSVVENNQKYLLGEIWEKYKANNSVVENNQKYLSGEIWEKYKANNSVVENNQKYSIDEILKRNKENNNFVGNNPKYTSKLIHLQGNKILKTQDNNLKYIGEGGFAKVYELLSTGIIIKKLKPEFRRDKKIKHRFKREYELTKSLINLSGIIEVYQFYDSDYSYTMEKGDMTLEDYINNGKNLSEEIKINIIKQVLHTMSEVHNHDVIHRDISPNNILLFKNQFKICDFGLGKDLGKLYSCNTMKTQNWGKYAYCAPEQIKNLGEADKRSDVFALGSIINFIMTKDPMNNRHFLKNPIEKSKSQHIERRYNDAGELLNAIEKTIKYYKNNNKLEDTKIKIENNIYDNDIQNYICSLNGLQLCEKIIELPNMCTIILKFISESDERQEEIIGLIEKNYLYVCNEWSDYDKFGNIAYQVICNKYCYVAKEMCARILYTVAYGKNRFSIQEKINKLIQKGIDPLLEEILKGEI